MRALGAGHSFNRVADCDGVLVRLDRLPPEVAIDPDASTVTVAAGMRYADVAAALDRSGYALANLASTAQISVAGACATATHGSGDSQPCLSSAVSALQLVAADGSLVELSAAEHPDVFPGAVVSLGSLGVVTRITLAVEPSFRVRQQVRTRVPLDELADRFDDVFGAAYSVSAFTDWRSGSAAVWLKHRTDRPAGPWRGGRAAPAAVHPVPGGSARACTEQGGRAGPWHERLPHFRPEAAPASGDELQSECYLPRAAAPAAIAALHSIGGALAPALRTAEVRTVRGDDLWLSPAYARDSAAFHFTWTSDAAAVLPALAAVEEALAPLGARPHWGKLTASEPEAVIAHYPRAGDFAHLSRTMDPDGKFRNAFTDALFPR
ncbi:alditol oxidase [Nocardiopsis coralliicola]